MLERRRLIMASNRGPVEFSLTEDGPPVAQRGSGGVVTALTAVSRIAQVTWIAAAMSEGDRVAARMAEGGRVATCSGEGQMYVRFVEIPRVAYQRYYNIFCNPLLWFIQHYMWNTPRTPNISRTVYDAWESGYLPVNRQFAEAIVAETRDDPEPPYVILHDYHLYTAVGEVRERLPGAVIQHFTHIPWPDPRYWDLLPQIMRRPIYESLCSADVVGLQTMRDVRNFLHSCEAFLDAPEVDYRRNTVWYRGHLTHVRAYPISVDTAALEAFAESDEVRRYDAELAPLVRGKTIVRVDRAEPSKNILRGFRAYELLMQRYPQLRRRMNFLAFIVPSRTDIGVYQTYTDEIFELVEAINDEYGTRDWTPVSLFYENNYAQAIAAMRHYDVLLVNPLIDGMNLVAKEGAVVNRRDGVILLSEGAGAFEQLQEHVIPLAPADIEGAVRALHQALTMPKRARASRARALRRLVHDADLNDWLERQLRDLVSLT
jgi:trehalose 6-phosphate synthase